MTRGSSSVKVTWHLVPPRPGSLMPEHCIGKWLVCCHALDGILLRSTAFCVVDDFGDLVPVTNRGTA